MADGRRGPIRTVLKRAEVATLCVNGHVTIRPQVIMAATVPERAHNNSRASTAHVQVNSVKGTSMMLCQLPKMSFE